MRRIPVLLATVAAAVGVGVVSGSSASSTSATISSERDMHLVGVAYPAIPFWALRSGLANEEGTTFGFGEGLTTTRNVLIGHSTWACSQQTHTPFEASCTLVLLLPDGTIFGTADFTGASTTKVGVTGGTDAYQTVRGEILVVNRPNSSVDDEYLHLLP